MPEQTAAPFDGRNATITAPNASVDVVAVPEERVFKITRFHVSNSNPAAARVRFWDEFTDSDGKVVRRYAPSDKPEALHHLLVVA